MSRYQLHPDNRFLFIWDSSYIYGNNKYVNKEEFELFSESLKTDYANQVGSVDIENLDINSISNYIAIVIFSDLALKSFENKLKNIDIGESNIPIILTISAQQLNCKGFSNKSIRVLPSSKTIGQLLANALYKKEGHSCKKIVAFFIPSDNAKECSESFLSSLKWFYPHIKEVSIWANDSKDSIDTLINKIEKDTSVVVYGYNDLYSNILAETIKRNPQRIITELNTPKNIIDSGIKLSYVCLKIPTTGFGFFIKIAGSLLETLHFYARKLSINDISSLRKQLLNNLLTKSAFRKTQLGTLHFTDNNELFYPFYVNDVDSGTIDLIEECVDSQPEIAITALSECNEYLDMYERSTADSSIDKLINNLGSVFRSKLSCDNFAIISNLFNGIDSSKVQDWNFLLNFPNLFEEDTFFERGISIRSIQLTLNKPDIEDYSSFRLFVNDTTDAPKRPFIEFLHSREFNVQNINIAKSENDTGITSTATASKDASYFAEKIAGCCSSIDKTKYNYLYLVFLKQKQTNNSFSNNIYYFQTEKKLRVFEVTLLENIAMIINHSILEVLYRKELHKESIKSAVSAIMARNMSHNLGSHIITNTKNEIKKIATELTSDIKTAANFRGLSELLQYLQERQDFIAVIANGDKYSYGPLNLKSGVFDILAADGLSKRHSSSEPITNYVLNNIVKSEKVFRQQETTSSSDGDVGDKYEFKNNYCKKNTKLIIEKFNDLFYFDDQFSIKLEELTRNKKSDEYKKFSANNLECKLSINDTLNDISLQLDSTLAESKDKKKQFSLKFKKQEFFARDNAISEYNSYVEKFNQENIEAGRMPIELRIIDKRNDKDTTVFSSLGDNQDSAPISDIDMAIPYGINGRHALLSIIENIIRNSAKHNDLARIKETKCLDKFIISIVVEDGIKEKRDVYKLTICDNLKSLNEVKAKFEDDSIGILSIKNGKYYIKPQKIINDGNSIDKNNKGLKEILICTTWLNNSTNFEYIQKEEEDEVNKLLKVVGVKEITSIRGAIEKVEDVVISELHDITDICDYSLGYQFYVEKFKATHIIDIEKVKTEICKSTSSVDMDDVDIFKIYCSPKNKEDINATEFTSIYKLPASLLYIVDNKFKRFVKCQFNKILPRLLFTDVSDAKDADFNYTKEFFDKKFKGQYPILYIDNSGDQIKDSCNKFEKYLQRKGTEDVTTFPNKEYVEYRTHYEAKYLKDGAIESSSEYNDKRTFIEGISGGNYTGNLIKTKIDDNGYMRIIESAYANIAIVDERIFASFVMLNTSENNHRSNYKDNYLRNKGIFILDCNEDGEIINLQNQKVERNSQDEFNLKHIDYFSIHYSLLEKLKLSKDITTEIISKRSKQVERHESTTIPELTIEEKLTWLFDNIAGFDDRTKVAIHSGRGGLIDNPTNMAFIPLSGLEWALNNCKYILFDLFTGQKYSNENIFSKK